MKSGPGIPGPVGWVLWTVLQALAPIGRRRSSHSATVFLLFAAIRDRLRVSERTIYYLAAPIARRDDGTILTDDAVECLSAEAAIRRAEQMSRQPHYIGAWAFSHTGYPAIGRFNDAEVLKRFGTF
jgi:hypothetical protein